MNINECINKLLAKPEVEKGATQSDEMITQAEKSLGLLFPSSYRFFLSKLGYISWDDSEIFGISDESYFDVTHRTLSARRCELPDNFKAFPTSCLVLNEYAGGGYYLLFDENSDRVGEVSLILDETFYREEQTWGTFEEYIVDRYLT